MLSINLKARLENKTFWVSLVSAVVLLIQQCGLDVSKFIPGNYVDIINTVFAILTILGITVDTSTPGVSDQSLSSDNSASSDAQINEAASEDDNLKTDIEASSNSSASINVSGIQAENEQLKAQLASIQSAVAGVANDSTGVTA
jgi:phi LC3 family holin